MINFNPLHGRLSRSIKIPVWDSILYAINQKELGIEIKEEKTEVFRNAVGSIGICAVKELSDGTE